MTEMDSIMTLAKLATPEVQVKTARAKVASKISSASLAKVRKKPVTIKFREPTGLVWTGRPSGWMTKIMFPLFLHLWNAPWGIK
jgi:hypothetical protein